MNSLPVVIDRWIRRHITKPIRGFEHKLDERRQQLSYREQQEATYKQLYFVVCDLLQRGKNRKQIFDTLNYFK